MNIKKEKLAMKVIDYYTKNKFEYPNRKDFTAFQVNSLSKGNVVHESLTKSELIKKGFTYITELKKTEVQKEDFIVIHNFNYFL